MFRELSSKIGLWACLSLTSARSISCSIVGAIPGVIGIVFWLPPEASKFIGKVMWSFDCWNQYDIRAGSSVCVARVRYFLRLGSK